MRHVVLAAVGGLIVGLVLGVAAVMAIGMVAAGSFGEEYGTEEYGGGVAAASAQPGDCFRNVDLSWSEAREVDCTEAHATEVYARRPALSAADVGYPDPDNLRFLGEELCMAEFEPYVGRSYWDSELDYVAYVPDRSAWEAGQRDVVCALEDVEGRMLERSSQGSRR